MRTFLFGSSTRHSHRRVRNAIGTAVRSWIHHRISFQSLHIRRGNPTGPGPNSLARATAYCSSNSAPAAPAARAASGLAAASPGSVLAAAAAAAAPASSRFAAAPPAAAAAAGVSGAFRMAAPGGGAVGGRAAEPEPDKPSSVPWWTRATRWKQTCLKEARDAEARVLKLFPVAGGAMASSEVRVGPAPTDFLHTLSGGPTNVSPPVVMMPGYGAGVGFYYRNFPSLAQRLRLFAVDWLGTGLSGRPSFEAQSRQQAEDFFLDSLAEWRRAAGLEGSKMVLVGHSLGGYLAANYALRHPEHVQHLVLVCPAGVPRAPEDWERSVLGDKWSFRGQLFKAIMWGWGAGITPGSIIRGLGPLGQRLVHGYVSNRFSHHGEGLSEPEIEAFKRYFYHIAALPGSGEHALRHLLSPGAWAYAPLEDRLHELKVPVTFIYGKHDWMKPEHAVRLCERLRAERPPKCANDLAVEIIDDAGHFVFMDQPELFDKALTAVVAPYLATAPQRDGAAAYSAAGTRVHTAAEAAVGGPGAGGGGGGASAMSWGFAASEAAATDGGPEGAEEGEAVGPEGVRLEAK